MKKLLDISSEERNRILEMHQSATKRNYLSEQSTQQVAAGPTVKGVTYKLQGLTDKNINDFLNVTNNGGLCEFFDPVFYDILNQTRDKKNMVGWVSYCGTPDPGNPCCDMVSNLKDYINVLAKSFTTTEQFKTYPFSKYMETAAKGKVFKSLWTQKMKDLLDRSGNGNLYDVAKAKQLLGTKGQNQGQSFDNLIFSFLVNQQLEKAKLPKMTV